MARQLVLILLDDYVLPLLVICGAAVDATRTPPATPIIHRNVAGYVSVRFSPEILRVGQGELATGLVHVSVHQPHQFVSDTDSNWTLQHGGRPIPALHACLVDQSIATASWSTTTDDDTADQGWKIGLKNLGFRGLFLQNFKSPYFRFSVQFIMQIIIFQSRFLSSDVASFTQQKRCDRENAAYSVWVVILCLQVSCVD